MNSIRKKTRRRGMLLALGLALAAATGVAVELYTYQVPWYSVDGGGGKLQGGAFTLTGAVGQCDAGALSGGAFALNGGFVQPDAAWSKNAVRGPWWLY